MKILVYGINYSPELTGIGKYTGEMVEWLAAQGHEVRVITAPPYYPQWQVGENYSARRYKREEGRHGVALPAVRAKTAEHPETPVTSRQFCRQQFLSSDGATSLEAGSHYRRGANAVLHAGNAPAGETFWCAYRAAYSGLRSGRHAGAGPCRKRQRQQSGTAGNGVRT